MNKLYFSLAAICAIALVGCARGSEEEPNLDLTATSAWSKIATAAAQTETAAAPTATPRATATPEPAATRTPSPSPSPTPTATPNLSQEVQDRQLLERASREGRIPCAEGDDLESCLDGPLYSDYVVKTILSLPAYSEYEVLPGENLLGEYYDVTDPVMERRFKLLDSLGFRGGDENQDLRILRCVPSSGLYWCPSTAPNARPLSNGQSTVWALLGVFGPEWRPTDEFAGWYPCDVSSTNPLALWIEVPVNLGAKLRGLEPPCFFPNDRATVRSFHILVERLLDLKAEETASAGGKTLARVIYQSQSSSARSAGGISCLRSGREFYFMAVAGYSSVRVLLWPCNPPCPEDWDCEDATGTRCTQCVYGHAPLNVQGPFWDCPVGWGGDMSKCTYTENHGGCNPPPPPPTPPPATATPVPTPTPIPPTPTPGPPPPPPPPPPDDGDGDEQPPPAPPVGVQPVIRVTPITEAICVANPDEFDAVWEKLRLTEEFKLAYRWAYGEEIPQLSRMDPFCPDAPLYPDQAALSTLAHPTYRNLPTLRRGSDWFTDVSADIEPRIDLFRDLGFWGVQGEEDLEDLTILWCRATGRNFCPSDSVTRMPVNRGKGTVWAELALHTATEPNWRPGKPYEGFLEKFKDMKSYPLFAPWVAAFVENFGYYPEGKFCPTKKDGFGQEVCPWTQGEWLVILYRINQIHQELGIAPLGVSPMIATPSLTPTLTPTATP